MSDRRGSSTATTTTTTTTTATLAGRRSLVVALLLAAGLALSSTVTATTATAATTSTAATATAAPATADAFDTARTRWKYQLTGGADFTPTAAPFADAVTRLTASAQHDWQTLPPNPAATASSGELWPDLSTETSIVDTYDAFERLRGMALAYSTHGSALEGDPALLASTIGAVDWLNANRYNTSIKQDASTWYWALGIPMHVNDISVLLYDQLGSDRIARLMAAEGKFLPNVYTTGPYSTGANKSWSVKVIAVRGVLLKDAAKTMAASQGIVSVLQYVKTGDGFYADGSFVQHGSLPYNGGYGASTLTLISEVFYLFAGSPWQVTDPSVANIYASVKSAFAPFMADGAMMEGVRGREISREYYSGRDAGAAVIDATALLAESAVPATAKSLRAGAKTLLLAIDGSPYSEASSVFGLMLSSRILADSSIVPTAALNGSFVFSGIDRYVRQAPGYAFGVSASSARVTNFETASNGENQKAWFTADGMTYLYLNGSDQYGADYWATVNPYRLPGTTVDTKTKAINEGRNYLSSRTFAGGVTSSSMLYAAYGMQLDATRNSLVANKSWFAFDDEIVMLGSGISDPGQTGSGWDKSATHVETIVDDRRQDAADQTLTVDGKPITSAVATTIADPSWAQIAGSSGQIGYIFPGTGPITAATTANSGSWQAINAKSGTPDLRTDSYFSLVVNHGKSPVDSGYAYIVLPNSTTAQTQAYSVTPETTVLSNTSSVAAVKELTKNAVGALFYTDQKATVSVGGRPFLTSSTKAAVFTEETATAISVSVSDPTQSNTGTVEIEINRAASRLVTSSPGVTVTQLSPTIKYTVDVAGDAGAKTTAKFAY